MKKNTESENLGFDKVSQKLDELESRLSKLESKFKTQQVWEAEALPEESETISSVNDDDEGIEFQVGESGMAWLGNIVLLFGIVFLLQLFKSQGYSIISSLFGYAAVAGVYSSGYLLRKHHPIMANLFSYNGHLLLFIVTLRLHFTATDPLIGSKFIALILLLTVISVLAGLAFRRESQVLTGIVLSMMVVTAVISGYTPFMLGMMIVIAAVSVFFVHRFGWWNLLILSIIFVYMTFLMWAFNNPVLTHTLQVVQNLQFGWIYLLASAFMYSMLAVLPSRDKSEQQVLNVSIILNGLGFSVVLAIIIFAFFKENYYFPLGIIAAFSIAFSALLQSRGEWKLSAALYALYGFAVLSITIAGIYKFPLAFLLLSVQSLLVVSMALWFRSRFIVIMNLIMFVGLLVAYFGFPKPISSVDFAFAVVALVTARIINWKKNRLEIKTELVRNIYLVSGFLMTLISLHRAVPNNYVTLSWTLAAGLFFILSLLLHNIKYRWLAISTIIVTAIYFFMVDLRQVGIGFRIIALLLIAVIALSFSIYYSTRLKKKKDN